MSKGPQSSSELFEIVKANASKKGFYINNDEPFVKALVDGLFENLKRYGYGSCPCRLAANNYEADKDILCPCVYMKKDVETYGMCFCCLYVSKEVYEGIKPAHSIPESRPKEKTFSKDAEKK
jgi:ferredoxin-thioredoxin reductase catalytic subunit